MAHGIAQTAPGQHAQSLALLVATGYPLHKGLPFQTLYQRLRPIVAEGKHTDAVLIPRLVTKGVVAGGVDAGGRGFTPQYFNPQRLHFGCHGRHTGDFGHPLRRTGLRSGNRHHLQRLASQAGPRDGARSTLQLRPKHGRACLGPGCHFQAQVLQHGGGHRTFAPTWTSALRGFDTELGRIERGFGPDRSTIGIALDHRSVPSGLLL